MKYMQFNDLEISKYVVRAVKDMKYTEMTPIQEASIKPLLEGKDVIGQAKTGTGKTAAFAIPAIEAVDKELYKTQILILTPTRELAIQVCQEIRKFAKYTQKVACEVVYGGEPIDRQIRALRKNPAIVIGTPGRVLDHIGRRVLRLKHIKTVILDEADEMLNMGFRGDIEKILSNTPEERQTVLFSATMPQAVLELAKTYQKDPVDIKIESEELTVNNIDQYYVDLPRNGKVKALEYLLKEHEPKRSLIFCNTKRQVDKLLLEIREMGYTADGLHGDMNQNVRTKVMTKYKRGDLSILVATDVAARGIDVKDIDIVFNYDIPSDMDFYVHRIGRTARAGKAGMAVTFSVGKDQLHSMFAIERFTNSQIKLMHIPDISVTTDIHVPDPLKPKRSRYQNNKRPNHTNSGRNNSGRNSENYKPVNTNKNKNNQHTVKNESELPSSPVKSGTDTHKDTHNVKRDRKTSASRPKESVQKISLDEYFKKEEATSKPRKDSVQAHEKNQPEKNPPKKNAPIHKYKSRIKYNGFNNKK